MTTIYAYGTRHIAPRVQWQIDVQHLPNPHSQMSKLTGLHRDVLQYLNVSGGAAFTACVKDVVRAVMQGYERIGVRCLGGRHRSAAVAFQSYLDLSVTPLPMSIPLPNLVFVNDAANYMWELLGQGTGRTAAEQVFLTSPYYK